MRFATIVILIFVVSATGFSQGLVNFNYQITYPSGETSDYIDQVSFRGAGLEWRKYLNDNISAGISLNWNVFNQVATELSEIEEGHVSGTQNRTINSFPRIELLFCKRNNHNQDRLLEFFRHSNIYEYQK